MSVLLDLSPEVESKLRARAEVAGEDLPAFIARLLTYFSARSTSLMELSGPIYQNFLASGMTDDELADELERAKHEARAARRAVHASQFAEPDFKLTIGD